MQLDLLVYAAEFIGQWTTAPISSGSSAEILKRHKVKISIAQHYF